MKVAFCRYPGCGIRLTDPVSVARGFGPDHDPNPRERRIIRLRMPPLVVARPRGQPSHDEPSLFDLLANGEAQCQQQP